MWESITNHPQKNTVRKFKVSSVLLPELPGVLSRVNEPIRVELTGLLVVADTTAKSRFSSQK